MICFLLIQMLFISRINSVQMMKPVGDEKWTHNVVEQLSPQAEEYASDVLHNDVEPIIQNVMSQNGLPGTFKFNNIDFGIIPPKLLNVKTHKKQEGNETTIIIDGELNYDGNCDLRVSLLGISSGVKDLRLFSRGRIVLKPTSKKALPFFVGGAQFYLLETPIISFDLDGIAAVCDWPLIREKVRKELYESINKKIVYPNRITIPLSNNVDPMKYRAFTPIGMVAVKLLSAHNLPKKGGIRSLVGQGSPDTYAEICLGAYKYKTDVKKNSQNPNWERDGYWHEFLLELFEGHRLNIRLFDEDTFSRDEFLGEVFIDLQNEFVSQGAENGQEIKLKKNLKFNENRRSQYVIQGTITVAMRWLPLGGSNVDYTGPTELILSLFVHSCTNLVVGGNYDTTVNSYLEIKESNGPYPYKSETKEDEQHPNFEYGKIFQFSRDWKKHYVDINVMDVSGFLFGGIRLTLKELASNPIKKRIKPLNMKNSAMTITLSAYVKTL
ncbi:extended synaptotagmin-2 [Lepeophtheirus salmonis]|uniref:extended synaptotagmin-2 n=1 Tax=Lepeophtheirus salmonis TaxID=72036 RepID=UPI001AE99667|nr:extended synaptotagmin-3-like [Lepeophtheirus salmonis]XP_040575395.1 extended synaptotagmin-3-like [Lepeophtheirus salmonis]